MFNGSYVALVTPFTDPGAREVDYKTLAELVEFHINAGTHGLVAVGTTGESPTLSVHEHMEIVARVVENAGGRIPVIAGAGSNNTAEAIEHACHAKSVGADGMLHVTGYYNRPNQEGIFQHFRAIVEACDLPLVIYNVPARVVVDIQPATMARIAALDSVVGVKDATCDLSRPLQERAMIHKKFAYLSGEDATAVSYNAAGGQGCISVTANVAPGLCAEMQNACAAGDFLAARQIQDRLLPLHLALFREPSPAGVKYACELLGLCFAWSRLPLVPVSTETRHVIQQAMKSLNLLS